MQRIGPRACAALLALTLLLVARPAPAETLVGAGSTGSATWTPAGSPYTVQEHPKFTRLTIEAGTTVVVDSASIDVEDLIINGTAERPVDIHGAAPSAPNQSSWGNVYVTRSAMVSGAIIRNANRAIWLNGAGVKATIRASRFDNNLLIQA